MINGLGSGQLDINRGEELGLLLTLGCTFLPLLPEGCDLECYGIFLA